MLNILEPEGTKLKVVIDGFESLIETRRYYSPGSIEVKINRHLDGADDIAVGDLVMVNNDPERVYFVEHRDIILTESGKQSEVWTYKGAALAGLVDRRIILPEYVLDPAQGASYETYTGPAEDAIRHFIYYNLIAPRVGTAVPPSLRAVSRLVLGSSGHRGPSHTWAARFQNLREYIEGIAKLAGLGWRIVLDPETLNYVFECYEGEDRSRNQEANPPVIVSPEFGSARSLEYMQSVIRMRNVAYVAGQGEGAERLIVTVGEATGKERRELFIDARDLSTADELSLRGAIRLAELQQAVYLKGQLQVPGQFEVDRDFYLGDIVTVENRDWGVTVDGRVTEVVEVYQAEGYDVTLAFDFLPETLLDVVRDELRQSDPEVRR